MVGYKVGKFPRTRIATIDVCEIGNQKHYVVAIIEIDVSASREKIKKFNQENSKISFTAWLTKAISHTIKNNEQAAAYLKGKRKYIIFSDINISIVIEKEIDGYKVPIPLIIDKANERSIESITSQIRDASAEALTDKDILLHRKSRQLERIYYLLPGFIRRIIWRYLLKHPQLAFNKMGNVGVTSIGMMGKVNGWFIPKSVHPICFGISAITKKPIVIDDKVEIREILNMTILLDHDIIDGAPMARFINDLSENIEKGIEL